MPAANETYEMLAGLVVGEDGAIWGDLALPWQVDDALAVINSRRCFEVRPRGASKSTDAAAVALSLLITEAPLRARCYLYAVDEDQAAELLDIATGIVQRTPGLAGAVKVERNKITVNATGATLKVEPSDAASAFSRRPWLVVADELTSWPVTANHRRLWASIVSAMGKVAGSRLLVLSMAGSPVGPWRDAWDTAVTSPNWHTSHIDGPCPWWDDADIADARDMLTEAEFRRYVLAEWVEVEQALGAADDVLACVRSGPVVLPPRPGARYVAALDVGTRRDMTALAVAHAEPSPAGRRVVVDRVRYWRPSRLSRVDLAEVQAAALAVCREYSAPLRFDRSQAEQLSQNLARAGVRVQEFVFSQAGANRLAKALYTHVRDHAVEIPDEPELVGELQTARLIETGPGTVKLQNPVGTHDDVAVAIGMCVVALAEQPGGQGYFGGRQMVRARVVPRELDANSRLVHARDTFSPWRGPSPLAEPID